MKRKFRKYLHKTSKETEKYCGIIEEILGSEEAELVEESRTMPTLQVYEISNSGLVITKAHYDSREFGTTISYNLIGSDDQMRKFEESYFQGIRN